MRLLNRPVLAGVSAVALLVFSGMAVAGGMQPIQFGKGKISTVISDSVVRGEQDHYTFNAQAGQKATLAISALEDNAVFQLYYAVSTEAWEFVPGAAEGDDARIWYGALPKSATGEYLVTVGGTRGNAGYDLFVGLPAVAASADAGQPENPGAITRCYAQRGPEGGTAVELTSDATHVTGYFAWQPAETDGAAGMFKGTIDGGQINAVSTYVTEGDVQESEMAFRLQGNHLAQGQGEMVERQGKLVFKEPASLNWGSTYTLVDCETAQDLLAGAYRAEQYLLAQKQ